MSRVAGILASRQLNGQFSRRLLPLLALFLLYFPLALISGLCHETGHGVVSLITGGTFTGIIMSGRQMEMLGAVRSPIVSIGGWLGQYAIAVVVILISRKYT